jgi:predicted  nucleic acid-binding Zn-ribbon protein
MREQIAQLEELAAIDEQLRRVEEQLRTRRDSLQGLRTSLQDLEARLGTDRASVAQMEKTQKDLHAEIRNLLSQIERSREKYSRSRTERETAAAQRELEELRKLVRDREDEMEKLNNIAQSARNSIGEAEGKASGVRAELDGTSEGTLGTIGELEKEKAELEARRGAASKALPPVLYRRYEAVRQRRPRAIASTHDGTCNGCHIAIPPMMYQKIMRQEEFDQCPNCRRIVYYAPAPAAAPPDAEASA